MSEDNMSQWPRKAGKSLRLAKDNFDKWQIAEARCEDLRRELAIHRERWQVLVNAIADKHTGGLVVGSDDMAVDHALLALRQTVHPAEMRERAAIFVRDRLMFTDTHPVIVATRALPLEDRDE